MKRVLFVFIVFSMLGFLYACGDSTQTFTVNYIDFDGSVIATYVVLEGQDAPVPSNPFREGYVFEGWYPSHKNIRQNIYISPNYFIDSTIFVLTHLEGIESSLSNFMDQKFEIIRTIEEIQWERAEKVIVLYEDGLRRLLHPIRLGGLIQKNSYVTYTHEKGVNVTMIYLDSMAAFEEFFDIVDHGIFETTSLRLAYDLYPIEGKVVFESSRNFDSQLLIELLGENTLLSRQTDDLRWFYTSEEIYIFLGEEIPSFLSLYENQLKNLDNEAIKLINNRGQRLFIGRSKGSFAKEYYNSFVDLVKLGFEGSQSLTTSAPSRFNFPQLRISDIDYCYTRNLTNSGDPKFPQNTTVSHEIPKERIASIGQLNGLVVMIGFDGFISDLSDNQYLEYIKEANKAADDYYDSMSEGKLTFNWIYHLNVVEVPYFLSSDINPGTPGFMDLINAHIELVLEKVEETIDLTNVDFITFYWPSGNPSGVSGLAEQLSVRLNTQKGNIYNYSLMSGPSTYVLIHELAHNLGLTDTYIHPWVPEFAGKPFTYKYGHWDLMAGDNELKAWHRWILSWIPDEQVNCLPHYTDEIEFEIFLEPVNSINTDTRLIVISLSETQAISIELRGPGKYCPSGCNQNILVTHIDSSIGNGNGPLQILRPKRSRRADYSDALLRVGEYVKFENITIIHTERYALGSVITIQFD